jgi:hypothetical protein
MSVESESTRSLLVGKAIARTIASVMSADPSSVAAALDECCLDLVSRAENEWERVEIMRRIAEAKI